MPYDDAFGPEVFNDPLHYLCPGSFERIEEIDFRDFPYHDFGPDGGKLSRTISLKNGHSRNSRAAVRLISIHYLNSNNPNWQYAVVTYLWDGDRHYGPLPFVEAQVFQLHDHHLSIVEQIGWKVSFGNAVRSMSFNMASNAVTARTIHPLPGDDWFEPSAIDLVSFRWNGRRFIQIGLYATLSETALKSFKNYNQAIRQNPRSAEALHNRGIAYEKKWDNDRAIKDFNQAIKLDTKDALALHFRAIAYYNKGDYKRAIRDFSGTITLVPNDDRVFYNRGIAYYQTGQYEQAIQDFTKVLNIRSDTLTQHRQRNLSSPQDGDALNNRAMAYYKNHHYEKAMLDFRQAIIVDPKLAEQVRGCRLLYRSASLPVEPGITGDPSSCSLSDITSYYLSFRGDLVRPQ